MVEWYCRFGCQAGVLELQSIDPPPTELSVAQRYVDLAPVTQKLGSRHEKTSQQVTVQVFVIQSTVREVPDNDVKLQLADVG